MPKPFFHQGRRTHISAILGAATEDEVICKYRAAEADGADSVALELRYLDPKFRNTDSLKRIIQATPLPTMAVFYRNDCFKELCDDEPRQTLMLQAADAGDAAAQAVIDRWCVYVAAGMTDLVNSLAPEMILIGGGISRQGERILSPIREYVAEHCFGGREGAVPIIAAAKLGNEAGIIGAAAL